jgi:hypothetical protein
MGPMLSPLNFNVDSLGGITKGLGKNLDSTREFLAYFRNAVKTAFGSMFDIIFNIMLEVQRTFINIKDMMGKMVGIMTTLMYILNGSIMTMQSAWDGPPGGLVRALCFHPETLLKLKTGELIKIKDMPLNSILENGTRVCAVMEISNLDEKGQYVEKMYKVRRTDDDKVRRTDDKVRRTMPEADSDKVRRTMPEADSDIVVSGSHLIYEPVTEQFMHVEDLSTAELTDINCATLNCLITSDHTIPIGGWIFHDWEDCNGSPPKNIGQRI